MKTIDLRSDTVTKPSQGMRKAMYEAEVGDDVFKEDPTVKELEEYCAGLFGKEAALFTSSGVMGNQLCLRVQTSPGDEVICERSAHIFNYESGSPAALSGIQIYPVEGGQGGVMPTQSVEDAVRPSTAYYMPRTAIIALENTHNRASGAVLPLKHIQEMRGLANKYNLKLHLDGARLWNASAATGIPVKEYAQYFDTVSACFSKGLGAPVGSIILGSKEFINEAFRIRKAWGGGMRQTGILAAAAKYALLNNLQNLPLDHEKAKFLFDDLGAHPKIKMAFPVPNTNILLFEIEGYTPVQFINKVKVKGLLLSPGTNTKIRAVTHLDVSKQDVITASEIILKAVG
ncbi:MAG: aminotransferase class I/II-fold pyridoxal phosphate-dependent enzyme [Ignavibacteriales bacterium]|nr:aminotransferase class I/II-fold pyridoxal phosphate-dependent enzyme [Ignavibacteriales bacterium]